MPADSAVRVEAALCKEFIAAFPLEAARVLEDCDDAEVIALIAAQPPGASQTLLRHVSPLRAAELVERLEPAALQELLAGADAGEFARMLSRLQPESQERVLGSLDDSVAAEIRSILLYPPTQAGSLMTSRSAFFNPDTTVGKVLDTLRRDSSVRNRDVFIVDVDGYPLSATSVEAVALGQLEQTLRELPSRWVEPVLATDPAADAISRLSQTGERSLPVTDVDGRLVGVIAAADVLDTAEQMATMDIQKMFGAGAEERALSKPLFSVRRRLPWLYVNLMTAFLAALVVGLFESTIAQFTALAVLLPVVAGQSGNSGAQALAVSMRGLALREIRTTQWRRVASKELLVGFANGAALAVVTGVAVFIWSQSIGLALVIAAAMVIAMTVAGLAGTLIPIILRSLGQDPAQSSSIILTTVTDVVGFGSFLVLASTFSEFL